MIGSCTTEVRRTRRFAATLAAVACGIASGVPLSVQAADQEWTSLHGTNSNQRYATLGQINTKTVGKLSATWVSDPFADGATSRMTPLVHDGLMFLAAGPRIYALNARDGKLVWVRQTELRKPSGTGLDLLLTGLAITRSWGLGLGDGMVFAGLMNGHVIALGEKDGKVVWDKVISNEPLAVSKGVSCTPLFADGVLYIGLGQEFTQGHVVAVDAKTGNVLWRMNTIPGPGEKGHDTWPQNSEIWRSGGGHPWTAGAADSNLGLVYFSTGNAGPDFGGGVRPGDNLYSVSIIALEMKTGKIRWFHQLVHHDVFEYDLSVPPLLYDVEIRGRSRRGVAVMRGDGYVFLFDRATGEPLVPIDERAVPQTPSQLTSPTQPFPRGADTILPPCDAWKDKIPAGFVLGCTFDAPSHDAPNRLAQWASVRIAPMSFDPRTNYFYAQGANSLQWRSTAEEPYLGDIANNNGFRIPRFPRSTVIVAAIDSRTDKVVWRKELPAFDDSGYKANGGSLSTAGGLVFHQGGDGTLQAYDAANGRTLWQFQTDFTIGDASPMSYALDGKQYVAFVSGPKVWAFSLGGTIPQELPPKPPETEAVAGPIQDTNEIETLTFEQTPANGHRYRLNEYAFNPYRARVRVGAPVTFINNGFLPHTIVAEDGSWTTGTLGPTQIATVAFDRPGRYLYLSKEYPWSYGQIVVVPETNSIVPGAETGRARAVSEQIEAGKTAYIASCSACHGVSLAGQDRVPALAGRTFASGWAKRDALNLFDRIQTTMPLNAPGSLGEVTYAAIVSFILDANENPASVILDRSTMKDRAVTKQ